MSKQTLNTREIRTALNGINHAQIAADAKTTVITVHNTLSGVHQNTAVLRAVATNAKAKIATLQNVVRTIEKTLPPQ